LPSPHLFTAPAHLAHQFDVIDMQPEWLPPGPRTTSQFPDAQLPAAVEPEFQIRIPDGTGRGGGRDALVGILPP